MTEKCANTKHTWAVALIIHDQRAGLLGAGEAEIGVHPTGDLNTTSRRGKNYLLQEQPWLDVGRDLS